MSTLFNQSESERPQSDCLSFEKVRAIVLRKIEQARLILSSGSTQLIEKSYKQMSQSLMFLTRYLSISDLQLLRNQLSQCFHAVLAILSSTQYEKFGHRFPIYSYLLRKFQYVLGQKISLADIGAIRMMSMPWSDKDQKKDVKIISKEQSSFLKTNNIQCFFLDLINDRIRLQNMECVCCAQLFINNSPIQNNNPLIPKIVNLAKKGINKLTLQRYLVSLCNEGGGVLIIGSQKNNEGLISVGVRWKNNEEVEHAQQLIKHAIQNLRPMPYYLIERVLVHSNFMKENENYADEYLRICLRVIVLAQIPRAINYIEYSKKGSESSYQLYHFDLFRNSTQIKAVNLYQKMHQMYQKRKKTIPINSHKNILCYKPYLLYSKIFIEKYQNGQITEKDLFRQQCQVDEKIQETPFDDEPKFKYRNMSLIVTNSKKNERYVLILQQNIKSNKKQIQISKPFPKSFNSNSGRSIWIASHQSKFSDIKTWLTICEQERTIKQGTLKIMPVTKKIYIQGDKFNKFHEQKLATKFKQRYETLYIKQMDKSNCNSKQYADNTIQLNFNNYSQAIYAFMLLEEMQIRGRFMNDIYKDFCYF